MAAPPPNTAVPVAVALPGKAISCGNVRGLENRRGVNKDESVSVSVSVPVYFCRDDTRQRIFFVEQMTDTNKNFVEHHLDKIKICRELSRHSFFLTLCRESSRQIFYYCREKSRQKITCDEIYLDIYKCVCLHLTGNGSKYYFMLCPERSTKKTVPLLEEAVNRLVAQSNKIRSNQTML